MLTKAPSAELRPDQRDDESLPPYEVLDPLLEGYVEGDRSADDLVADGYDPALVGRVVGLVDRAEYKRRQMPPGVRITTQGLRQGPAHADHQPVPRRSTRAATRRTGAEPDAEPPRSDDLAIGTRTGLGGSGRWCTPSG